MPLSSAVRHLKRFPQLITLLVAPILLVGCALPQLISIKAGEVDQVNLQCNNSKNPEIQDIKEQLFWVMVTDGEETIRAKYRVLKKGKQGGVIARGLTPDTVSLVPGKYVVEVTHPESGAIHSTDLRRIFAVLRPSRVWVGFSADQQPVYKDVLHDQYTYKRGGKVVLSESFVKKCNP